MSGNSSELIFANWLHISKIIIATGCYSTIFSVFIFLYLTCFLVKTTYDNYKRYMVVFSLLGVGLASIEYTVNPIFHSYNAGFVMFSLARPFDASTQVAFILLLCYTAFYGATISFLTVQFLYRYLAIVHPNWVPTIFGGWKIILWITYSFYFGIQWAVGVIVFAALDSELITYMKDEILDCYGKKIEEIPMLAILAYDSEGYLRWFNLMCILNMTVIMGIQYSLIVFFGWRMVVTIKNAVNGMSPVLLKIHTQFFKVLVLQILVPTITLFMPVFVLMYTPLLHLKIRFPTGVLLSAFSFFPAMDAVIVMYILTEYRMTIKKIIGGVTNTVNDAMRLSNVVESTLAS